MKRFLLAFSLVTVLSFNQNNSVVEAQGVSINVNIGNQPAWGPVGYDYAAYYYLPDIDVYYDINRNYFYYWDRGAWRSARYLPYNYGQYDLYGMYKVVINQPDPWRYHDRYRREYGRYRGNHSQIIILNSPDRRYDRVRYNRVDWINPNRPGRYPNYHNNHPGYDRPNNNRPNYNGGGNNGRPDNNNRPNYNGGNNGRPDNNNRPNYNGGDNNGRPDNNNRPNYNGGSNNGRPNPRPSSSSRTDQSSMSSRSSDRQSGRSSGRSSSTNDRSNSSENNGRSSGPGRTSSR